MLEWIISSSVLIAVVIALRFALKGKISLHLQYALWALVLVRLLIPFSFGSSSLSVMNSVEQSTVYQTTSKVVTTIQVPSDIIRDSELTIDEAEQVGQGTLHRVEGYPMESGRENLHTYTFQDSLKEVGSRILRTAWLCGMSIIGLWFASTNLILSIKLKKSRTVRSCENCLLPAYTSDAVDTPCLFGLFRPAIYLTSEAVEDETVARHAIEHELTHYRHRDNIWAILRGVCLAVHWYNPLVWWAAILSRNDAELACDEGTIRRLGESERAAYGRTLIGLTCEKRTALLNIATTMTGSGKSIKERIALIAKKPKMALYTLVAVILVAAIAVGCTFTGAKDRPHSFTEWTESLTTENIQLAEVAKEYGTEKIAYTISKEEYDELCEILTAITENDCSLSKPEGDNEDGYRLVLYRADKLWLFKCLSDGTIGLMFNDAETGAYFGCEGSLLIIENPELWNYIKDTVDKQDVTKSDTETPPESSPTDLVVEQSAYGAVQDVAYFLELAALGTEFHDMDEGNKTKLLEEYGDLLAGYTLLARETEDGKTSYIVGRYNGEPAESPLYGMYGIEVSTGEDAVYQFLYREEDAETVEAMLAANKSDFPPSVGYRIEYSQIFWSPNSSIVLIQPKDNGLSLDVALNRYLYTPNGREYIADAASRGIDMCSRTEPFLYVYLISERFGEIAERISLAKAEVAAIQAEERVKLSNGFGFSATLHMDGQTTYFNERSGVPQSVLDLAVERCGYQFATPGYISSDILEATLDCDWLDTVLYANDADLPRLKEILQNAEFGYMGACGYGAELTLTLAGGETLTLFKGTDSCDSIAFGSYGGYFLGQKENLEFWEIFGLDPDTKEPVGSNLNSVLSVITLPEDQNAAVCSAILTNLKTGWWKGGDLVDCTYEAGAFECVYSEFADTTLLLYGYAGYFRFDESKNCVENWFAPAIITLDLTTLEVTDIWWPGDGAYYESDILSRFPEEIADIVAEPNEERAAAVRSRLMECSLMNLMQTE